MEKSKSKLSSSAKLDLEVINILKGLVIDGVHNANCGHPGGAMSSMDFAYILFTEFLSFDPSDPKWLGRDRFILSAGHESMLLYSLFHMMGWLSIEDLKAFRQIHSKTPGHPENFLTPGVECTTGPLGQGVAMSVGFAIGGKHLSATLSKKLFGAKVYALCGDGCMQEDITYGAASYAGHLGLDNLVWYYDKNKQQISGSIDRVTSDDEEQIFSGFGWDVYQIDGHDHKEIRRVLNKCQKQTRPVLIVGDSTMAKGAYSMEGSCETHGSPLPKPERINTKKRLKLPEGEDFFVSPEARSHFQRFFKDKKILSQTWRKSLAKKMSESSHFAKSFQQHFSPISVESLPPISWNKEKPLATREAFGKLLAEWESFLPQLVGGSADLEPSNMTGDFAKQVGDFSKKNPKGRNLAFGVREFPMSAITNGLALHGGFKPFDATFLAFSDYSRPAIRLGAIQKAAVIHEMTHDSIFLGEDGPTHQAVEHVMSLRMIPDLDVIRPADAQETEIFFKYALTSNRPSVFCLSRQKLPILNVEPNRLAMAIKGGYVLKDAQDFRLVLIATGSEVSLALAVADLLKNEIAARVVSLPCWELFFEQPSSYRKEVLGESGLRVSLEAGVTLGWERVTGEDGLQVGIDTFGASGSMAQLAEEFGFTAKAVAARVRERLAQS